MVPFFFFYEEEEELHTPAAGVRISPLFARFRLGKE